MEPESHVDTAVLGALVKSPWVRSFVDQARPGDTFDPDATRRTQAWAAWCISSLVQVSNGERAYPAVRLPGSFYDPQNTGPRVVPHLEVPRRALAGADPEFPLRLGQAGNGLLFPYWRYSEVTALRRALFNTEPGPIGEFVGVLNTRRGELVTGLELTNALVEHRWTEVAELIFSAPDGLSVDATDDFSTTDIAAYFPTATEFELTVRYDSQLRSKNKTFASRRVGVWQVAGVTPGGDTFSFGVVTPRLTINSLFTDPLFLPPRESEAALLVRTLLLRRLAHAHLALQGDFKVAPQHQKPQAHLRAVPARPGAKLPEASVACIMRFLEDYPSPQAAWAALEKWSEKGYLLTITEQGFTAAHKAASRAWRRVEEPLRTDIDNVLPLAWDVRDGKSQVVRVTYASDPAT